MVQFFKVDLFCVVGQLYCKIAPLTANIARMYFHCFAAQKESYTFDHDLNDLKFKQISLRHNKVYSTRYPA